MAKLPKPFRNLHAVMIELFSNFLGMFRNLIFGQNLRQHRLNFGGVESLKWVQEKEYGEAFEGPTVDGVTFRVLTGGPGSTSLRNKFLENIGTTRVIGTALGHFGFQGSRQGEKVNFGVKGNMEFIINGRSYICHLLIGQGSTPFFGFKVKEWWIASYYCQMRRSRTGAWYGRQVLTCDCGLTFASTYGVSNFVQVSVTDEDQFIDKNTAKYNSSLQQLATQRPTLTIGDGDFSFSRALVAQTGGNVIATCYDDYPRLLRKYGWVGQHLKWLRSRHVPVLYDIDAEKLSTYNWAKGIRFRRIIFNQPLAFGSKAQRSYWNERRRATAANLSDQTAPYDPVAFVNRLMLDNFLREASSLLTPDGEIEISKEILKEYDSWMLPSRGSQYVRFKNQEPFDFNLYPGYKPVKSRKKKAKKDRSSVRQKSEQDVRKYVFVRKDSPFGKDMSDADGPRKDEWRLFCEKFASAQLRNPAELKQVQSKAFLGGLPQQSPPIRGAMAARFMTSWMPTFIRWR